jgi:transposase
MKTRQSANLNQLTKAQLIEQLSRQEKRISSLNKMVEELAEQLRLKRHQQYGASSEKSDPNQQPELFDEAEELMIESVGHDIAQGLDEDASVPGSSDANAEENTPPKKPRGRKPLPEDLERRRVEHDIEEHDKVCTCGCQKTQSGEDISEKLNVIPMQMFVEQHVRMKYACPACEGELVIADPEPTLLPKSNAGIELQAFVVTGKFQDALPLHRQTGIFKRFGIDLPRNTLANWMLNLSEGVQPIIDAFEREINAAPVILMDETSVQVNKEPGKAASSKSYMWIRRAKAPPDEQAKHGKDITLFHYSPSRSGQIATELLANCQGAVMTDGYAGYYQAVKQHHLPHAQCWAHARRKFVEAEKALPKGKKSPAITELLSLIQKLYGIEKALKDNTAKDKQRARQENAKPILEKLKAKLEKKIETVAPKGKFGEAIGYTLKHWPGLTQYLENGHIPIDNNGAENGIRPFVIGRKNWMFADTQRGANASAKLYSIIETAKANGHDAYHYLCYLFRELPKAKTEETINKLLPWNVDMAVTDQLMKERSS